MQKKAKTPLEKIQNYFKLINLQKNGIKDFKDFAFSDLKLKENVIDLNYIFDYTNPKEFPEIKLLRQISVQKNEKKWLAKERTSEKLILIKILDFLETKDMDLVKFLMEYLLMKSFDLESEIEGICKIRKVFRPETTKNCLFIIYDYGNANLDELLEKEKNFSEKQIIHMLHGLTKILVSLKKMRIFHGNLTPENIIITLKNEILCYSLFDFRISLSPQTSNFFENNETIKYNDFERKNLFNLGQIGLKLTGYSLNNLNSIKSSQFLDNYSEIFPLIYDLLYEKKYNLENLLEILETINKKAIEADNFSIFDVKEEQKTEDQIALLSETLNIYYKYFSNIEKSLETALNGYNLMKTFDISKITKTQSLKKCEFLDILGTIYQEKHDFSSSLIYFQEELTVKLTIFDKENEEVGVTLGKIAEIQGLLCNKKEALDFYTRSIEIHRKNFGDVDQISLIIYYNMGLLSKSLGNFEKAKDLFEKSLKIAETIKSSSDFEGIICELAKIYSDLEYNLEIEEILPKLENLEKNQEDSIKKLKILKILAKIYRKNSQLEKSLSFYQRLVTFAEKTEDFESLLNGLNNIAEIYFKNGDLQKNLEIQTKAIKIIQKLYGETHQIMALTYRNIAEVNKSLGEREKALDFYYKAFEIYEKFNEFKEEKASICEKIADIFEEIGDMKRMREYLEKSNNFFDFHDDKEKNAVFLNRLGLIYYEDSEFEKAKQCFQKSLEISIKFNNEDSEIYRENLGKCLRKLELNEV